MDTYIFGSLIPNCVLKPHILLSIWSFMKGKLQYAPKAVSRSSLVQPPPNNMALHMKLLKGGHCIMFHKLPTFAPYNQRSHCSKFQPFINQYEYPIEFRLDYQKTNPWVSLSTISLQYNDSVCRIIHSFVILMYSSTCANNYNVTKRKS